ncbi:MAG: fasciclin domain-containing protein [Balneolales bacterium]|nr:fasciclin domain-containing protein [Balneolales bacterium]
MKRFKIASIPALILMIATYMSLGTTADHHSGPSKNIVELAVGNDNLSTLVAAVQAADLVDVLAGDGPFTVFAPTNEAFAALPDGTLEMLLLPENKEMVVSILTLHVVPGKGMSGDLSDGMTAASVNGENLTIGISYGNASVNGSGIIAADVEASNGVVHVIDTVILPSN